MQHPDSPFPRPNPTPRRKRHPDLEIDQILGWADAHHALMGEWPTRESGFVAAAARIKWRGVDAALRVGLRGLQGGSSLAQLLAERRDVRNRKGLPPYTRDRILAWADAHFARTGQWPNRHSGPVVDAPGETWTAVEVALIHGHRGLPGGSSLARLLARHRGIRNRLDVPRLSEELILRWADAHHRCTGHWPIAESGPIGDSPGETWQAINQALRKGSRGLPGGCSLARFLEKHRGAPNHLNRPGLLIDQILAWADAHHARTGRWPTKSSGPVEDAPNETWAAVGGALRNGARGLPGGTTLHRLIRQHRGG